MLLEDTYCVDLSVKPLNGILKIPIIDAGLTNDSRKRELLFHEKLETYKSYLSDQGFLPEEGFEDDFSGVDKKNVSIVVYYKTLPTQEMLTKKYVFISDKNSEIKIPIFFEPLDENKLNCEQLKAMNDLKNKKWWQFWI